MRRGLLLVSILLAACSSEPQGPVNGFAYPDAHVAEDAAVPPPDAGFTEDAGGTDAAPLPDAGFIADASGPVDTGVALDSGAPADAGIEVDLCATPAPADDRAAFDALLACLRDPVANGAAQRAARDRLLQQIEARGGFPIITATEITFVYVREASYDAEDDARTAEDFDRSRRATPIHVAGDFNAWALDATSRMSEEAQEVFHTTLTLDAASGDRWGYKLVANDATGADVYFSDPLSRRFDYDPLGRISIVRGGASEGHLERMRRVVATGLGNTRDVYVYLPPGYDTGAGTYPVLYMHDGNNLFSPDQPSSAPASWEVDRVLEAEIAARTVRPFIVVGVPNNANRRGEYTHVPDRTSSGLAGGDGAAYADFLVNELKPQVDGRYRTNPGRESTGVLGSSLGGLISYYIGLLHPQVFRFVGGMSSTFDWGRFGLDHPDMVQTYQMAADLTGRDQVFYLDSGGGPPTSGCTTAAGSGSDNYCSTVRMREALVAAGFDTFPDDPDVAPLTPAGIQIMHWWSPDAPHNELSWQDRIHRAFRLFARP